MKYCPNYISPIKADDKNGLILSRIRCKRWECPYCAGVNRRWWLARIGLAVEQARHDHWYFATFTLDGEYHVAETADSFLLWRASWDVYWKRIRRLLPKKLTYLRVYEPHKDGTLHVHMLIDSSPVDVTCVRETDGRDVWMSLRVVTASNGLVIGARHDWRPIKRKEGYEGKDNPSARVAGYVGKYLTKEMQGTVRGVIRSSGVERVVLLQTSRGFPKPAHMDSGLSWSLSGVNHAEVLESSVYDIENERALESADFYGEEYYPNRWSDLLDRHVGKDESIDT